MYENLCGKKNFKNYVKIIMVSSRLIFNSNQTSLKNLGCGTFKGKPYFWEKIVMFNLNFVYRYYQKVLTPLVTFWIPAIIPWYLLLERELQRLLAPMRHVSRVT
jgi:hypothetical protein